MDREAWRDEAIKMLSSVDAAWPNDDFLRLALVAVDVRDAKIAKLRKALANIDTVCDEEIQVRRSGMPEEKRKGFRVMSLLRMLRNLARHAVASEPMP